MVVVSLRVKLIGNSPCTVISPDMETREVTAFSEEGGNISVKGPRMKASLCSILNALFFAQFITPAVPFLPVRVFVFPLFWCVPLHLEMLPLFFRTPVLGTFYSIASLSSASACHHHHNQAILKDMGDHLEEHLKP